MKILTSKLKPVCSTILFAIDTSVLSDVAEILQIVVKDNKLLLSITNTEYYVTSSIDLDDDNCSNFIATIKSNIFLKFISKITSEYVELYVEDSNLKVKSNGEYKFPLIYKTDASNTIPQIAIGNVTQEFDISSNSLISMCRYNSNELSKLDATVVKSIANAKSYYVDEKGAVTMSSSGGACVNTFTLAEPVKLLLTDKVVKLFKLFNNDETIHFVLGQDSSGPFVTTRAKFTSSNVEITAILPTKLAFEIPVDVIRTLGNEKSDYVATFERDVLLHALERLLLFIDASNIHSVGKFTFSDEILTIAETSRNNVETVKLSSTIESLKDKKFEFFINLQNIRDTLTVCESSISIGFGNNRNITVNSDSVTFVIAHEEIS